MFELYMILLFTFSVATLTLCIVSEVEFHQQCKRRRIYREPSVSPVEVQTGGEKGAERTTTPLQYPPTALHPDELNREPHYKQKARFLMSLGLEPVPPERRRRE